MTRMSGSRRRPVRGPGRRRYEAVADRLLDAIRDGTYRPGHRLPSEATLMIRYRVGRSTVREAMLALGALGIVTLRNGAAARVAMPSPEALTAPLSALADAWHCAPGGADAVAGTRRLVEIGLAREAAAVAGPSEVAALEVALARNEASIGDADRFEESDLEFHATLARIVGNPVFSALLAAFTSNAPDTESGAPGIVESMRRLPAGDVTRAHEQAYREHVRVFRAIATGDPEGAASAMGAHFARGGRPLGARDHAPARGRTTV